MKSAVAPKGSPVLRPPVIAIMGHIDHGKSTLLDFIRKTNIVAREAGGITQHVGAYEVVHPTDKGDKRITFLDTPGHAAFTGIRERGAKVADIAVLVVSAEEGVKPQTVEALKVILKEEIPYIVAINKIDSPKADIERTKQSLAENEIYIEGYGGSIPAVPISAKTGEGVPALLDMMLLVAELEELIADPSALAEGIVIEANRDMKKGVTATIIIQNGTLAEKQFIIAGGATAPVRIMEDFAGKKITTASFSSPVRIIGWSAIPDVGSRFIAVTDKKEAERISVENAAKKKNAAAKPEPKPAPEAGAVEKPIVPLIIKADVSGSMEAIQGELAKLNTEKVGIKVLHSAIGTIGEGDVKTAVATPGSIVLGFGVKIDPAADSLRERLGVTIHTFDIIYKLVEWVEAHLLEMTPKETTEETTGRAKIMKTFSRNKDKQIVGGKVETGTIKVGGEVKILRRELEIGRGRIRGLQQQKEKATEIAEGYEFGAEIESRMEIMPGDRVECFILVTK